MGPLTRGIDGRLLERLTAGRFPSLPSGMKSSGNSDFTTPLKTFPFTSGGEQSCGNEGALLDDERGGLLQSRDEDGDVVTAAALYWELQVVSFPGNGRTVGGGRAALPKLNWGVEGRGG